MSGDDRLDRMRRVAAMVFDARAAELRTAAARCAELRARLSDLERGSETAESPATALFFHSYEAWAATRRAAINIELAAARADWMSRLDDTRLAFGRHEALIRLSAKAGRG